MEPNLSAVTWQYLRPSDNTNLRAERKNGIIRISGTFKGKPQDKVSFALTAFTWAWTGLFWYDQETGQLVQSGTQKGKNETILWQVKEFIFS